MDYDNKKIKRQTNQKPNRSRAAGYAILFNERLGFWCSFCTSIRSRAAGYVPRTNNQKMNLQKITETEYQDLQGYINMKKLFINAKKFIHVVSRRMNYESY